jgi:hypothetical protein
MLLESVFNNDSNNNNLNRCIAVTTNARRIAIMDFQPNGVRGLLRLLSELDTLRNYRI